jgi:gluconokinase
MGDLRIPDPPLLTVMGVSGSGKTTVGAALAQRLGVPYADADDFHPPENVAKMAAGTPLTDDDRGPWLEIVGAWLADHIATGGVMSCSALAKRYRDVLRSHAPSQLFVHCDGSRELIGQRMLVRPGHFMPPTLLDSQFAALEPLEDDENGLVLDVSRSVDQLVDDYLTAARAART